MKSYAFDLSVEMTTLLFTEVHRIKTEHPKECLVRDQLWSDSSEKGNSITRGRDTGTLCYSIAILRENHPPEEQYLDTRELFGAIELGAP